MGGPVLPPVPPNVALPPSIFDSLIGKFGVTVQWLKAHGCPCAGDTGNPNPDCQVCLGRAIYWDPPQGPFIVLMTFVSYIGRNVNIGAQTDQMWGPTIEGEPVLTVPVNSGILWTQASMDDAYVETAASMRFNATLRVGQNITLPHGILGATQSLTVAPSGAVVVQDPTINQPISGVSYTVSGAVVTLNTPYPIGTAYTVEYYSCPIYVAYERFGALPHVRPFGQGFQYPKRFKISILDYYLRNKLGSSTNIQSG